jgi:hypothetical protein
MEFPSKPILPVKNLTRSEKAQLLFGEEWVLMPR